MKAALHVALRVIASGLFVLGCLTFAVVLGHFTGVEPAMSVAVFALLVALARFPTLPGD